MIIRVRKAALLQIFLTIEDSTLPAESSRKVLRVQCKKGGSLALLLRGEFNLYSLTMVETTIVK